MVAETIVPDATLLDLLVNHKKQEAKDYWQTQLGGISMVEHGIMKILDGLVDPVIIEQKIGMLDISPARLAILTDLLTTKHRNTDDEQNGKPAQMAKTAPPSHHEAPNTTTPNVISLTNTKHLGAV